MRLDGSLNKKSAWAKMLEGIVFAQRLFPERWGPAGRVRHGLTVPTVCYRQRRLGGPRSSACLQMVPIPPRRRRARHLVRSLLTPHLAALLATTNSASTRSSNPRLFRARKQAFGVATRFSHLPFMIACSALHSTSWVHRCMLRLPERASPGWPRRSRCSAVAGA